MLPKHIDIDVAAGEARKTTRGRRCPPGATLILFRRDSGSLPHFPLPDRVSQLTPAGLGP